MTTSTDPAISAVIAAASVDARTPQPHSRKTRIARIGFPCPCPPARPTDRTPGGERVVPPLT